MTPPDDLPTVTDRVNHLLSLRAKHDPEHGAGLNATGKDVAAIEAARLTQELVRLLTGWAFQHRSATWLTGNGDSGERDATGRVIADDHRFQEIGRSADPMDNRDVMIARLLCHGEDRLAQVFQALNEGQVHKIVRAAPASKKQNAHDKLTCEIKAHEYIAYREALGMEPADAMSAVARAFFKIENDFDLRTKRDQIRQWPKRNQKFGNRYAISTGLAQAREWGERRKTFGTMPDDPFNRAAIATIENYYGDAALSALGARYKEALNDADPAPTKHARNRPRRRVARQRPD